MGARRVAWVCALLLLFFCSKAGFAHPMGNFSVNRFSKIEVLSDRVRIRYLLDLAEIPTFQELQKANLKADEKDSLVMRLVSSRGEEFARGLVVTIDGGNVPLRMVASEVIFPPGAGGLPTMKMGFTYDAALSSGIDRAHIRIQYSDLNFAGQSGWKEVVASAGSGELTMCSVPSTSRSAELSNYPTDLLNSPPQDLEAVLEVSLPMELEAPATRHIEDAAVARAAGAPAGPKSAKPLVEKPVLPANSGARSNWERGYSTTSSTQAVGSNPRLTANTQATPRDRFTELIAAQRISLWFLVTAAMISIGLGGLHALEPGHGKTIVAAYLVGSRGTARHALLLGIIVTASHTAGVFALGAVTLYVSRYIVPEQLYPWLGALSGMMIAVLGIYMLMRRLTGTASDHSHEPGSSHGLWPFPRKNRTAEVVESTPAHMKEETTRDAKPVGAAQLLTLGITGGIVPCPAALVVLLSAFAMHRIGFGLFLIVAFSLGLAAVLVAFGLTMVYARRVVAKLKVDGRLTRKWLPAASSAFIAALGIALAIQSLSRIHIKPASYSVERIGPFLFVIGLGLVLGMRHSTDADHVVAISTIVSREKSIRSAALIGSVWGLGHTVTVFTVGALIILFGVEIPPRLGLSMEFSVALMLVLLGVLNLNGMLRKITARFTRDSRERGMTTESPQRGGRESVSSMWSGVVSRIGVFQLVRPLTIGLVHGLAGSAAVALLVLSTIHDPVWATGYLLVFGLGTMAGMMAMTTAISLPLAAAGNRSAKLSRYFGAASGMVSLCFGAFLVYQLGFVGGLFTGHPHWTPQ